MEKTKLSFTLKSGQVVTANTDNLAVLSAKFQVWSRQYGLTDSQSLACFIAKDGGSEIEPISIC